MNDILDDDAEVVYVEPEVDTCRRCGQRRLVNSNGYCSRGCELGYAPDTFVNPCERFLL